MTLSALLLGGRGGDLTSFFSLAFLFVFLPSFLIIFSIIPKKGKKYWMLAASYLFFWFVSGTLVVYLFLSTLSMHYFGMWLEKSQIEMKEELSGAPRENKKAIKKQYIRYQRWVVFLAVLIHIGILLILKYSGFFTKNLNSLFLYLDLGIDLAVPEYLMPIGISFFTLQALSYILDVYQGIIKADHNLFRLALFISFFPQIVEGPICRYSQTAEALWEVQPIRSRNFYFGLQRILFGMMKKVVIADRLNKLVTEVFLNFTEYEGGIIAIAAVCYTVQLYMDFSGTMDAVMGIADILGICMPENFARPFFSKTISEFWKRWHITLGTWFKDYVFYPVTMASSMKNLTSSARKRFGSYYGPLPAISIALFCVWACNGLWHGSAWHYVFFGMYHFILILAGKLFYPVVRSVNEKCHIRHEWFGYRLLQMLRTAILVVIGELFFRADGLRAGLYMFRTMILQFTFTSLDNNHLKKLGADRFDFLIVGVALILVWVISIVKEKGVSVREAIAGQNIVIRWTVWLALLLFIIVFGAYGLGYTPVDPMYAQF